jgi:hypothetical protein
MLGGGSWKQALVEGSTNLRPVPVIFCDEEDPFDNEGKSYIFLELELKFMGNFLR